MEKSRYMYFNSNFPNLEYFSESRKKIRRKKGVGGEKDGDIQGTGWPSRQGPRQQWASTRALLEPVRRSAKSSVLDKRVLLTIS